MAELTDRDFTVRGRVHHPWAQEARDLARANPGQWVKTEPPQGRQAPAMLFSRDFDVHQEDYVLYIRFPKTPK